MNARELLCLESASLQELRAEWERRYGAAPELRSADLLRQILSWRIQTAADGGLDRATRRMLKGEPAGPETFFSTGTVITREWKGEEHNVEIVDDGYLYGGRRWSSLSKIARHITGTRWNGPRFFGLRKPT